ncbi:MAG: oligosaccharide flippase family protein [Terracidiphilus sp.]
MRTKTSHHRKHLIWSYVSTSGANVLRVGLGAVSGLLVSRLLMPRGRGELAILLYFPTLMGAFFSLGTPQAITALISKSAERTEEILTTGFRLAVVQVLLAVPLFVLCAPLTLTGDNRQLAVPVEISCACGAFMILVPYFNAMAYGLRRFTWVNAVMLAGQAGYVLALLILWLAGTLTPLAAALAALGSQLLQCLLHLIHIKPQWLNRKLPRGAYSQCLALGIRFAAPSLAAVVLLNADRAILIRTTTLEQIGYFAIAFALTMPITITTEAFTQIGFVEVSSAESSDASFALMLRRFQMAQVVAGMSFLLACALVDPVIRFGFGKAYVNAIPAAYPLALAMALRAMTRTLENNLRGLRFIVPGTVGAVINLTALIVLSVFLVPRWGAFGFCCASLISEAIYFTCLALYLATQQDVRLQSLWGIRPSIVRAMASALVELFRDRLLAENKEEVAESPC